jgi:hypothetical protein
MVNITSSADQLTNVAGSKLWVDDLTMIYNPPPQYVGNITYLQNNVHAYSYNKTFYVDYLQRNKEQSTVTVYDLMGRTVLSQTVKNNSLHSFDMSAYREGVYVYRVYCNGETKSGKFYLD